MCRVQRANAQKLSEKSSGDNMSELEQSAIALSQSREALKKRLMDARAVLADRFLKFFLFDKCNFDFEDKCLWGTDGYYLQWQVRKNPGEVISYENQQTSLGSVELERELTVDQVPSPQEL